MDRYVTRAFVSGLLSALVLGAVCLGSNWTVRGASTIIVPDDYSTIQEAINNAADGDTISVRAGIYYEHVVVNKTVLLVGEDGSATIIDGNNTGHVVYVVSDNVTVSGFTVQNSGNIQMPDLDAGICLNGTTGCTISGNRAANNGFSAISLLYSNGNTITDNNLSSAGWGGIHLMSSSHNVVSGNTIADKHGGINGHVSSNYNNITENTVSNCTYGGFYHASSYNNICRNNISSIAVEGIWLQDQVNYNLVAENNLINNTVGIRVQGPNYNNTLSRNAITGAEYGIRIENNARYTRIADNVIVNNRAGNDSWRAGIRLDNGGYSQIYSNIISGNYYGILLYSFSPRVSVWWNNITGNEFGVRVASGGSNNLDLMGNLVADNVGYGVGLTGFGSSSNYATITRNTIANNSDGIALGQYSNFNTISHNNVSMNDYGFYIEYSTQNLIHGNNIVDNSQQTYVAVGSANTWDDDYPSGGNYWSDYATKYPNASELDDSGIWDTPYVIDVNNTDRFPLIDPAAWSVPADVAITNVTCAKTVIGQSYAGNVTLTVENQGYSYETFSVTLYANTTRIGALSFSLPARTGQTRTWQWNTASHAFGNYTIKAAAEVLWAQGETHTEDNNLTSTVTVHVGVPGDVTSITPDVYDGRVDVRDVTGLILKFNARPGDEPLWNPNYDVNDDTVINVKDITIAILNFMQHE